MTPDWLPAALTELDRLNVPGEKHYAKKRATVLAIIDARLAGQPEESVWNRAAYPDVCSRSIFQTKWKHDPTFASVLANVDAIARGWRDGAKLRALATAAERLALASPVAAAKLVALLASADESIILRAAKEILDRGGTETATKNITEQTGQSELRIVVEYGDDYDPAAAPA